MRDFLDISDLPEDSLSRVFVDTLETNAMFVALDHLMANPCTASNGCGVAVLGPARCGKTLLVKEYLRRCLRSDISDRGDAPVERRPLKYLYVQLLPGTRLNTIPSHTLRALGHPAPSAGKHDTTQTDDVISMIVDGGYEMVIFDEVHHLTSSMTRSVRENGSHWLTHILDQTRRPMVLIGYSRFASILRENPFLGGRLVPSTPLEAYRMSDRVSFATFCIILQDLERGLKMGAPSKLHAADTAARLLISSGGRVGLLVNLLTEARQLARDRRNSCLTTEVLAEAVESKRLSWSSLKFNPFRVEDLAASVEKYGECFALAEDGPR
ncbi:TniB family NTP-binding protein [Roseomonas sp. USHLN139]|uniref:TniB family NTP-binding protein n=1 Tax=Roseomonas sp. USHLN139 TaxID=3081298 RepID=UPI003B0289FE